MMYERFDEALADSIKVEDITPNVHNQKILQCLKDYGTLLYNKPFDKMWILDADDTDGDSCDYIPDVGEDMGWLGYFFGQNISLMKLYLCSGVDYTDAFYKGLSCNKTIRIINLCGMFLSDGQALKRLNQFFKSNDNLIELTVSDCEFDAAGFHLLALAIGNCNKSLKRVSISIIEGGSLVDIITALSIHPQLEALELCDVNIGRNECTALSTLLRCTTTQLNRLSLQRINIDDEGVEDLVNALSNGHKLEWLELSWNESITIKGWKKVSTLLEIPGCKLEKIYVDGNNIGDEGVLVFASALVHNSTLKVLLLSGNSITNEGWAPFLRLLCDTSSVNNTYHSNHTLETIHGMPIGHDSVEILRSELELNSSSITKYQAAIRKIIRNHPHLNMEPFFEWEFKVLPIMISWFANAGIYCLASDRNKVNRMKLSALYDFIKEFPMLYVEPMTKKEIAEYTALEEQLQGDQSQQEKLEEIRQRKAHAMMRL